MYSFTPTEEQQMLIDTLTRYAVNDLRTAAPEAEEENHLPAKLIETGWEVGTLQASLPEDYGGFGDYSAVTGALAAEELAYGDLAGALAIMLPGAVAIPILLAGSEEQKQTYLPPIAEAEWRPYTAAILEYHLDFDPFNLRTTAIQEGDQYVLNGTKTFVPYTADAETILVYANLDGSTQGFLLPADTAGVTVGERQKLLGINALPVFSLTLENVKIPTSNRLGGSEGHDFIPILSHMQVANASLALGVSKAALEYAIAYAKEREVFGVKVAQKQAIAFMLAEMATEIEAIRLVVWQAAWMLDTGNEDATRTAVLANYSAIDMAMMVTDRAVQVLGGYGYIREYPVELWMRNGRGFSTFTGLAII